MLIAVWVFLVLWVGLHAAQAAFGVAALRQPPSAAGRRLESLVVSALASVLPLITLLLVLSMFVFVSFSNVAQRAGPSDLRSLWFCAWPILYFGNPVAFLGAVTAVFLPPYPPDGSLSFASRVFGAVAAGFAWYIVAVLVPDA